MTSQLVSVFSENVWNSSLPVSEHAVSPNVYVDSSVLLRVVLGEPGRLRIWPRITTPVASELIRLECLRAIDRARIQLRLEDDDVSVRRAAVLKAIETFSLVPIGPRVLERAADPFPTMLGSLDAIHLASALLVRDEFEELSLATHDDELAVAARAVGFRVHGAAARTRSAGPRGSTRPRPPSHRTGRGRRSPRTGLRGRAATKGSRARATS